MPVELRVAVVDACSLVLLLVTDVFNERRFPISYCLLGFQACSQGSEVRMLGTWPRGDASSRLG
eukprot:12211253-Heterocapsa_arctica.AAC.1